MHALETIVKRNVEASARAVVRACRRGDILLALDIARHANGNNEAFHAELNRELERTRGQRP